LRYEQYLRLVGWFNHVSNYHKLCDFAIAHYDQEWTLMLIDLIAREFFRFGEWLSREGQAAPRGENAGAGNMSTLP
jgi:hypothetical protein